MEKKEIARFERLGDVRIVRMFNPDPEHVILEEDIKGPSCELTYDQPELRLHLTLGLREYQILDELCRHIEVEQYSGVIDFLSYPENSLPDCMDLCDTNKIEFYWYSTADQKTIHFHESEK